MLSGSVQRRNADYMVNEMTAMLFLLVAAADAFAEPACGAEHAQQSVLLAA
jgi:hypothetical protein